MFPIIIRIVPRNWILEGFILNNKYPKIIFAMNCTEPNEDNTVCVAKLNEMKFRRLPVTNINHAKQNIADGFIDRILACLCFAVRKCEYWIRF